MTVLLISQHQEYSGHSDDTKPESPPVGSTFHEWNTGEIFVYNGDDWTDDLRLIYAISQAMNL